MLESYLIVSYLGKIGHRGHRNLRSRSCSHLMHRRYRQCDVRSVDQSRRSCRSVRAYSRLHLPSKRRSNETEFGTNRRVAARRSRLSYARGGREDAEIGPTSDDITTVTRADARERYSARTRDRRRNRSESSSPPMLLHFDRSRIGAAEVAS